MSRPLFLYYLFDKDKKPLYVSKTGLVQQGTENYLTQSGESAHVKTSPSGWRDTLVKYGRNLKYWGVTRDFTVPMKFAEDGAKIINWLMWNTRGVEAICYLGISKLDVYNVPYDYLNWYLSELNFAKFKSQYDGITIEALEGGISKYLKAFENTDYEIDITNDAQHVNVLMDGQEIENSAQFVITNGDGIDENSNVGNHLVEVQIINKEVQDIGGVYDVTRTRVNTNVDIAATGFCIFNASTNGVLEIDWNFYLQITYNAPPGIDITQLVRTQLRIINPNINGGVVDRLITLKGWTADDITFANGTTFHIAGAATLNVVKGDLLYFVTSSTNNGASGAQNMTFIYSGDNPVLNIKYAYRFQTTIVQGLRARRVGEALIAKMSSNAYTTLNSAWLDAFDEVIFTSADALRGNVPSVIKISFSKYFAALSRWSCGAGVEADALRIELIKTFFSDAIILDLGEVGAVELDVAEDLMFNTIKNGYKTQEYDSVNGTFEVNQGQQWATNITKIVKELDLTSEVRGDSLGAELMRINFNQLKTTDSRNDNDSWMLSVLKDVNEFDVALQFDATTNSFTYAAGATLPLIDGQQIQITGTQYNNNAFTVLFKIDGLRRVFLQGLQAVINENAATAHITITNGLNYKLYRPAYTSITGVPRPASVFNTMLRPKLALYNNGPLLHSLLDLQEGNSITLSSADKNKDFSTTLDGVTIKESDPIQVGALGAKLFRPYYLSFKTTVNVNLLALMEQTPYGKVKFTSNGNVLYGYLFDGGITPATNDAQTWKLLSAPENNLETIQNTNI